MGILTGSILLTGCIGGNVPQVPTETEGESSNGSTAAGWCEPGTSWSYSGSTAEGQGTGTYEIKGTTQYEGQEMCKAVYTYDQDGQQMEMNYYFTENENKVCYEMIDPSTGVVLSKQCNTEGS